MARKMVKGLMTVCVLLILQQYSFGQTEVFVGLKGGISIPNLKAPSSDNPIANGWESRMGPYFGAVLDISLSEHISLQTEINYSSQGGKKNGLQAVSVADALYYLGNSIHIPAGTPLPNYVYADVNTDVRLNYLELPLLFKYKMPFGEDWDFFINAGPYFGYLLAGKFVSTGRGDIYLDAKGKTKISDLSSLIPKGPYDFNYNYDFKSLIQEFNYGVQMGIGVTKYFENGKLFINIGGNYGLANIQKEANNGKNITGAATVAIGYMVKL